MEITTLGNATLICADVIEGLRSLPDESVQCCVTSPPYWGLRNYDTDGQIGLEETLQEWIINLVKVFREVKRVLRSDGTLWINLGDSYAGSHGTGGNPGDKQFTNVGSRRKLPDWSKQTFKPKDLMMQPARLAIALQDDGWYLRSEICWSKPNPMPNSATDRPAQAKEQIYLLTKKPQYYFDMEAVKEKTTGNTHSSGTKLNTPAENAGIGHKDFQRATSNLVEKRNLRNVWTFPATQYKGEHYATFPERLPQICILAGTSERGCCIECGSPWKRIVESERTNEKKRSHDESWNSGTGLTPHSGYRGNLATQTIGWKPTCDCDTKETKPCTVLDCFSGAATTGLVALKLNRKYIGIELNPDYIKQSIDRIRQEADQTKLDFNQ